jgi:hypothetical protein
MRPVRQRRITISEDSGAATGCSSGAGAGAGVATGVDTALFAGIPAFPAGDTGSSASAPAVIFALNPGSSRFLPSMNLRSKTTSRSTSQICMEMVWT